LSSFAIIPHNNDVSDAAETVDLTITVDNVLEELYIDGGRIPNADLPNRQNWQAVDVVRIPTTTQVIAVSASDSGVVAGILASVTGDRLLSNASWKCVNPGNNMFTNTPVREWFSPNYDDTMWPAASVILPNPNPRYHGLIAAISRNAKWIWTAAGIGDSRVYCRGRMNAKQRKFRHPMTSDKEHIYCSNQCE